MALSLVWQRDLRFESGPGGPALTLDSHDADAVSPMQALAYAVMGCMAMDVVDIVRKGRHPLESLRVTFDGDRAADPPRRYTAIRLHFDVGGAVPSEAVDRAIKLSHEKYCSVLHSLRQDIDVTLTFSVTK